MKLIRIVCSLILLPLFMGWGGNEFYHWWRNQPQIRTSVLNMYVTEQKETGEAVFMVYLYLTNSRSSPIHVIDYQLELAREKANYEKLSPFIPSNTEIYITPIRNQKDRFLDFGNISSKLIHRKNQAVEFGTPLHGFVMFKYPIPQDFNISERYYGLRYRITCIDALGNKHVQEFSPSDFSKSVFLQDLSGIREIDRIR